MILFTSKDCVRCKVAKNIMAVLKFEYEEINIEDAEGLTQFHLMINLYNGSQKIPALMVFDRVIEGIVINKLLQGDAVIDYLEGIRHSKDLG